MLEDASVPGSDGWYLVRLANKLGEGLPRMFRLQKYRDGDALIPETMWEGARESYMRFMRRSRLHVVETLRDARTNKQKVLGFRTAVAADAAGDEAAWKHWRASRMAIQSRQFFNDTADFGQSFLATLPDANGKPLFQVRNGWDTVAEMDPLRPWQTKYALTVTFDAVAQREIAVLYGQGWYRIATRRTSFATLPNDGTVWVVSPDWDWAGERILTPFTDLCLITRNQTADGLGIWEKHLDTVDRINEITLNALTLIVMQSFRQRAVSGNLPQFYPAEHPQAGQAIDYNSIFAAGPAALWMLPLEAKVWESEPTDIRPIYEGRKTEVETLASLTSTPQYVFASGGENQSAQGAELAREQITSAVENMNDQAALAFADAMSIAFQIAGDEERADPDEIEVMWRKPNPASLSERGEAAAKFKAGGATQSWIDENVLEMTPAQQRQAVQDRMTEAFAASIASAGGTDGVDSGSDPTDR
ncbi:hypothetical protein SK224_08300 [Microbacterium sp. BG28]|uniref:hypothetical protein n=1 Tax=Microbacterium sp. BG28 TaxID=3097356 RepID=UPI002A5A34FF|nr:hypothetical protein [Microbacterium sp. BG28]MDY0829125.1 hypothetical protein [Microbacterium sp. BG28]